MKTCGNRQEIGVKEIGVRLAFPEQSGSEQSGSQTRISSALGFCMNAFAPRWVLFHGCRRFRPFRAGSILPHRENRTLHLKAAFVHMAKVRD